MISVKSTYRLGFLATAAILLALCFCERLQAQDATQPFAPASGIQTDTTATPPPLPPSTTQAKFIYFLRETASPLTLAGGTFNAGFSQVTNTDPRYGVNRVAFAERFGASLADIASHNFFGDFVVASALHEDPRYIREGNTYGFWHRVGYALSRAVVIRTDSGGNSFNFDNVVGSGLAAGLSNLYYPAASRNSRGMFMHFGSDVADTGFVNLAPEFWPDFRDKFLRRHHRRQ
jgi:hypothetical protein